MPKRSDIKTVLLIGSGPIVIGQACEFDYSGTQACKALVAEGLEVILVNSNPATIMTDPDIASKVYIEPLKKDYLKNPDKPFDFQEMKKGFDKQKENGVDVQAKIQELRNILKKPKSKKRKP